MEDHTFFMTAFRNRRDALARIEALRLQDAVAVARKLKLSDLPIAWPKLPDNRGIDKAGFRRLCERELSRVDHPLNWHKNAVAQALERPRARQMYFVIRKNLWSWPEFLGLGPKARLILEIVIELARDEAFPWYVNVERTPAGAAFQSDLTRYRIVRWRRLSRETHSEDRRQDLEHVECVRL